MNIVTMPDFSYQLCERKNGNKFIKVLLYINDADGYVEVGRIKGSKSYWTDNGYGEIEDVYEELSKNANTVELLAKVNPTFPNPLFSRRELIAENTRLRSALEFYSNPENWASINFDVNGEKSVCNFTVTGDAGAIASAALNRGEPDAS
ncbi:hypothetical protein [Planococcus rifietoensis]|uniref:hypothetical protein n=1 Tax=Planococcus rifietoensis TaxID=200991 RepID=UPI00384D09A1